MGQCLSSASAPEKKLSERGSGGQANTAHNHSLSTSPRGKAGQRSKSAASAEVSQPERTVADARSLAVSALEDVLASLVLPRLHLQDLKNLGHTSSALRAVVNSMPESSWQAAAARALPPQHPVLSSPSFSKATIIEYGRTHAALRAGKRPSLQYVPGSKAIVSAVSPDDRLLAIVSRDGLLRFWELGTWQLLRITQATVLQFTGVTLTWAPDSKYILMATIGSCRCVLATTENSTVVMRQLAPGAGQIHRVLWSPDSSNIALAIEGQDTLRLLIMDRKLEPIWQSSLEPTRAAWAPDSSCLAYVAVSEGRLTVECHDLHISYDGSGGQVPGESAMQVRALAQSWQLDSQAEGWQQILGVQFSSRGGLLLLTEGPLVMQRLTGPDYVLAHPSKSDPQGPQALSQYAEWSPCGDKCCTVQATQKGPQLCAYSAYSAFTGDLLFSQEISTPDPAYWATYWRIPQAGKFCVSPDGKHLAVLDRARSLRILNAQTGAVQLRRDSDRNALEVVSMRWNTWGSQLYLQTDEGSIQIYTFYAPKKTGRISMSQRLLGVAAVALNVPRAD